MIITWATDITDSVFDHSRIMDVTENEPYDDEEYILDDERYQLTEEGEELYWQWYDDASLGYNLGNGRGYGLAEEYTQWQLYQMLISDEDYSAKID